MYNICDLMIAIGVNIDLVSFFLQKKGWIICIIVVSFFSVVIGSLEP